MLHTLSQSPWKVDIQGMLRLVNEDDALLLLSDGVVAAVEDNRFLDILLAAPITIYALKEDLEARGLSGQISNDIVSVDYTHFVRLSVQHQGQLAW